MAATPFEFPRAVGVGRACLFVRSSDAGGQLVQENDNSLFSLSLIVVSCIILFAA
jgi:hypothetical protein